MTRRPQGKDVQEELKQANEALLIAGLREQELAEEARRRTQELANALENLKRAEAALRETDRRKNDFLAMLSHELRNPLAPIMNSLFILERGNANEEQSRRALSVISRQLGLLTQLVDDLLDVTRVARDKIQLQCSRLELNELVRNALNDHRAQFERNGILLEFNAAPAPVFIRGDRNRLAQAIGNLLNNSAKFTGRGGSASVSVSLDRTSERAEVRIADTGIGLAPEVIDHLFEPFVQADPALDRSKGGLGLGLALVKGLVEKHGGHVSAYSTGLGQGAEFIVRLPLDKSAEAPEVKLEQARTRTPRRRVLIIEDNIEAAQSLRELLELDGHEIEVAYTGPEGIARAHAFRPEVVLCDIGLPGMNGYEVARALRTDDSLENLLLVALSGYALPEDLKRAAEAGFDRHIAKPPSIEMLVELLRNVQHA